MSEHDEQKTVVQYLDMIGLLYTASLGGHLKLPIHVLKILKTRGYKAGTPDLMIFEPRGVYYGLFIELKRTHTKGSPKGRTSDIQQMWLSELNKRGYYAIVCHGASEAINEINKYRSLKPLQFAN